MKVVSQQASTVCVLVNHYLQGIVEIWDMSKYHVLEIMTIDYRT